MKQLFTLLLICLTTSMFSQDESGLILVLNDMKKVIEYDSYILLGKATITDHGLEKKTSYYGKVISSDSDSIYMQADKIDSKIVRHQYKNLNYITYMSPKSVSIPKQNVRHIKYYGTKHKKKKRTRLSRIGGTLIATGLISALSATLSTDKNTTKNILYFSGAQIGTGITLALFSKGNKKYNINCDKKGAWLLE